MNIVRKYPKQIQIFNCILCFISIILGILAMLENIGNQNYGIALSDGLLIISLICALIYMYKGHGKDSAIYFKIVIYTFLVSTIISVIVNMVITPKESLGSLLVTTMIALIGFCMIAAVAFLENLGRKRSLALAGINLLMRFLIFVIVTLLFIFVPRARQTQSISVIYRTIVLVTLSAVIYINTCCKYIDKEERGTI